MNSESKTWLQQLIDRVLKEKEEMNNSLNQKAHKHLEPMKFEEKNKVDLITQARIEIR